MRNLGWTAIPDAFASRTWLPVGLHPRAESVTRCNAFHLPDPPFAPAFDDFHPF